MEMLLSLFLTSFFSQEDERLSCGKDADMLQVKDARKLLDEVVGGLWLTDDDEIVHM